MDVENTTAVPVGLAVYAPPMGTRTAIFTAKATFTFTGSGEVELDREDPVPILDDDEETELGLVPRDSLPRCDPVFEVMVLGKAHPPGGRPVDRMTVALSVGSEERRLAVYGDRRWERSGQEATISPPEPFETMPLTWGRAFGGKREVLIDVESPIDVADPRNPDGKGFDHLTEAHRAAAVFQPPESYPRFDPVRELPNLEDPANLITRWEDQPLPACWAPTRLESAIVLERLERARRANPDRPVTRGSAEFMHRAHPDWVIGLPPEGAPVVLHGLLPGGPARFALPSQRVVIDIRVGEEESAVDLIPRSMVLLPEERRFYIVYRHYETFQYSEDESRAARVRLERGWAGA